MHKLFEEVLTGETADDLHSLTLRADTLIYELGVVPADDFGRGCNPAELAGSVLRSLSLPEVASVRGSLVAECPVYAISQSDESDTVTFGIADAIGLNDQGASLIIDWKSDVNPDDKTVAGYREQVKDYLRATGVCEGLIIFATTSTSIKVTLCQ